MKPRTTATKAATASYQIDSKSVRINPQRNRHWPVIDQMHLHVGGKLPGCYSRMCSTRLRHKVVVQPAPFVGCGGAGKAGPVAARHIGGQRELAHDQQT